MVLRVEEKRSSREGESRLHGGSPWPSVRLRGLVMIGSLLMMERFRKSAPSFLKEGEAKSEEEGTDKMREKKQSAAVLSLVQLGLLACWADCSTGTAAVE